MPKHSKWNRSIRPFVRSIRPFASRWPVCRALSASNGSPPMPSSRGGRSSTASSFLEEARRASRCGEDVPTLSPRKGRPGAKEGRARVRPHHLLVGISFKLSKSVAVETPSLRTSSARPHFRVMNDTRVPRPAPSAQRGDASIGEESSCCGS